MESKIRRIYPTKVSGASPLSAFSVLLIGQGFGSTAEFQTLVMQQFWPSLLATKPFEQLGQPSLRNRMYLYYAKDLQLNISQTGNALSIPPGPSTTALSVYLDNNNVQNDSLTPIVGSAVWPNASRTGRNGSLVAAIVKGNTPGELYQLDSPDAYPTPLVGVVATGSFWPRLIIRAIGSLYAGLGDEYSLPDQTVNGGTLSQEKFPLNYFAPFPNLVAFNDSQRDRLKAGAKWQDVLSCLPLAFKAGAKTALTFFPSDSTPGKQSGQGLFEGGATFRKNIARGFQDCIMRRQPLATGADAIQADIDFCRVCVDAITGAMKGDPDFDLMRAKRATIDDQKTLYEMVNWGDTVKKSKGTLPATPLAATGVKPRWSFTVQADASVGVRVTQLKLLDRDGDPFKAAEDVMQEIDWGPLSVTWEGDTNPTQLNWSDAFSNTQHKPEIELAGPDPGGIYQLGFKVSLTWEFSGKRPVEVMATFVVRGQKNDFDPGGAAVACKFYPQIAMRVREPFKSEGKTRPKATSLQGAIVCVCNNIIPKTISAPGLEDFSVGKIKASFFTDSNSTREKPDNDYKLKTATIATFGVQNSCPDDKPPFGLFNADWKSGRLLAGVGNGGTGVVFEVDREKIAGSTALRGFQKQAGPLLPHWSWLFDYSRAGITSQVELKAATYASGETTLDGKNPGDSRRTLTKFNWPNGSKFFMTIEKLGRQGQYDNIHINAAMPTTGNEIIPAPFCGDMCVHVHWRWGVDAVSSIAAPYAFFGWGPSGKGAEGAHSTLGAPLIPPNQHLRVVANPSTDETTVTLTYDVTALQPELNWQVFLEQGIGIAFSYAITDLTDFCSPLTSHTFPALMGALAVFPLPRGCAIAVERKRLTDLKDAGKNDPGKLVELDAAIRKRFHDIYSQIRFYKKERDGFDSEQIPTPTSVSALKDLEDIEKS